MENEKSNHEAPADDRPEIEKPLHPYTYRETEGSEPLKCAIQVFAGLVPGTPEPEFTRSWYWTGKDQEALAAGDEAARTKWIAIAGESREYAASIEDPRRLNWVRREWIWL